MGQGVQDHILCASAEGGLGSGLPPTDILLLTFPAAGGPLTCSPKSLSMLMLAADEGWNASCSLPLAL